MDSLVHGNWPSLLQVKEGGKKKKKVAARDDMDSYRGTLIS